MTSASQDAWTPYGLEGIRRDALRRRRVRLGASILGVVLFLALLSSLTIHSSTSISGLGGSGTTVSLQPTNNGPQGPAATVSLTPGRVNVAPGAIQTNDQGQAVNPPPKHQGPQPQPVNVGFMVVQWSPLLVGLLLLILGYRLGGLRSAHRPEGEVNYGIYKGSMPLELITHRYRDRVVTPKRTVANPFGRTRRDYLPPEVREDQRGRDPPPRP